MQQSCWVVFLPSSQRQRKNYLPSVRLCGNPLQFCHIGLNCYEIITHKGLPASMLSYLPSEIFSLGYAKRYAWQFHTGAQFTWSRKFSYCKAIRNKLTNLLWIPIAYCSIHYLIFFRSLLAQSLKYFSSDWAAFSSRVFASSIFSFPFRARSNSAKYTLPMSFSAKYLINLGSDQAKLFKYKKKYFKNHSFLCLERYF